MKYLILLIVLLWSLPAFAQQTGAKSLLLSVNGVTLGTSHKSVLKKLGKPTRDTIGEINECNESRSREITYPGLRLLLYEDAPRSGVFSVGEIEVTSWRWNISGIRIGAIDQTVVKRFGKAYSHGPGEGSNVITWFYAISEADGPGMTNLDFRKGRLIRVYTAYALC
jgi:hypothetical protein